MTDIKTYRMSITSAPLERAERKREMLDRGYLILDSASTDFSLLKEMGPMILDAGVVVFICTGGEGRIVVDMHTLHIRQGSFVLLLPYSVVQVLEVSADLKVTMAATGLGFLEKLVMLQPIENYVARIREEPCLTLSREQLDDAWKLYSFAEKQYNQAHGPLAPEIRDTLLTLLALEIVSLYASNQPVEKRKLSRNDQVFRQFTLLLSKNFRQHRTVEFYAEAACLSPKHFSAIIKQRSGKLPMEWITERTIALIKFLLNHSSLSIAEIAAELNFSNQSFFTRYFKKRTGLTPTAYRAERGTERGNTPRVS